MEQASLQATAVGPFAVHTQAALAPWTALLQPGHRSHIWAKLLMWWDAEAAVLPTCSQDIFRLFHV